MEHLDNETKQEDESQLVLGDEEKVQDREVDGLRERNATFLTDLNLLIVALSLSSVCNEDCLNLVDTEKKDVRGHEDNKGKACIPRLHARKRETIDVKLMRRQTQKTQTILKDFRYTGQDNHALQKNVDGNDREPTSAEEPRRRSPAWQRDYEMGSKEANQGSSSGLFLVHGNRVVVCISIVLARVIL